MQHKSFTYPNSIGYSALVRKAPDGIIFYDVSSREKDSNFNAEVDNITNELYIKNILFATLVNTKGHVTAVVQLINQKKPLGLTEKIKQNFKKI